MSCEHTDILKQEDVEKAFEEALKKVDIMLETFKTTFPSPNSNNLIYWAEDNDQGWTQSFWTGILWLAYEGSGDEKYRQAAEGQLDSYIKRLREELEIDTHDLGFLYSLSGVAEWKTTGNKKARQIALEAADHLIGRYKPKGDFIQAWGDINDPEMYRLIIDCLMNLPLLYWATEETGDRKYREIAVKHLRTTLKTVVREDNSTFHTHYFDPETGLPTHGVTRQGYSDDSAWARGQAWGVYGMPLSYSYISEPQCIEYYYRFTDFFIEKLPQDYIPYWDMIFTDGSDEPRDSSAAAIAICGIYEMDKHLKSEKQSTYMLYADKMLKSLIDSYTTKDDPHANGLLKHAVYSKPCDRGVDECNIWGCYYYMEALVRKLKDWDMYW
ncbi:glycoside hydrolase family 88 protein [Acidaminobacter sp. JC074]|uniref:glycoside hydrolase family 88 protein n=1 Tax=Acidaminobacter sp. JC074 TaxID=2530199 RepID=UPI001F0FC431|nr:glycoside hydrolase family 88 protein [Acidaminobacter sp. JC074]